MPPSFPPQYQEAVLWILPKPSVLPLRDYHPVSCCFPANFKSKKGGKGSPQHHISIVLLQRIQFKLCRVRSLLLTASQLIFFPAGTKTLQFPAFPDPMGLKEKSHSEILGSKPTFSSPRHIVACHVLHQRFEPSHPSSSLPYVCNWISNYIWFIIVMC